MDSRKTFKGKSTKDKVCRNCSHFMWTVGVGTGVRCNIYKKPVHTKDTCTDFKSRYDKNGNVKTDLD